LSDAKGVRGLLHIHSHFSMTFIRYYYCKANVSVGYTYISRRYLSRDIMT